MEKIKLGKYLIKQLSKNTISDFDIREYQDVFALFLKEMKVGYISFLLNNDNSKVTINTILELDKKDYKIFTLLFTKYLFNKYDVEYVFIDNKTIYNKKDFFYLDKYKTILIDVDDTILSFEKCEYKALSLTLIELGITPNENIIKLYSEINLKYWQMVEKKLIDRDRCLIARFEEFLPLIGLNGTLASHVEDRYRFYLNKHAFLMDNARLTMDYLKQKFDIYAITNGVYKTQINRMKLAKIDKYFIKCFISDAIGHHKPSVEYFEFVKNNIENFDKSKAIIIGDSLTSDMKLGANNNVDNIWFNFNNKDNNSDIKPIYEISSLLELIIRTN